MNHQVLIVDDSLTVRMDLDEACGAAGLNTRLCATAEALRTAVAEEVPGLVILDIQLPDGDGLDLLAELRGTARTRDVPVILLSREAEVKDRLRGLSGGANAYVGKPYDPHDVVSTAIGLLQRPDRDGEDVPTVLVIDDSLVFRQEMAAVLTQAGYRPILASGGEEGLRRAADSSPDAIIVDGVMPDLDGATVVKRIRLDPGLDATPCLLLTAAEDAASEIAALDAGADTFVRKTQDVALILARLAAMLRSAEASRSRSFGTSLSAPKRILAVDDSRTYLEELAENLSGKGYEVIKAGSGEEALSLLAVEKVDSILLDLVMPGLSGTDTCRQIKNSPATRHIPLIMLTALDEQESMIEGINAGADDYVVKSAAFDILNARLRAQLRRKQFEDENRLVRDEWLRKDAEARTATQVAEARQVMLEELSAKNEELAFHARELERLNLELEMFAHSVSHDLRQPLRSMDGFSRVLLEGYSGVLDDQGVQYLERIENGARRMNDLIEGLLVLCRVSREPIRPTRVPVDLLVGDILQRLQATQPERALDIEIEAGLELIGDRHLIAIALENLLGNAWKFTANTSPAKIRVGSVGAGAERCFFVGDNGAGFDMEYADKMFGPFQRLHRADEFEGTGIGLATVYRIVQRHGGRIWAEGAPGQGATFYFTLPEMPPKSAGAATGTPDCRAPA